jgi:hypothetical protein
MERLHDYPLHPQIVTPDLLYEFGIMTAFYPDPARSCHSGSCRSSVDRTRCSESHHRLANSGSGNGFDRLPPIQQYTFVGFEFVMIAILIAQHYSLSFGKRRHRAGDSRRAVS